MPHLENIYISFAVIDTFPKSSCVVEKIPQDTKMEDDLKSIDYFS